MYLIKTIHLFTWLLHTKITALWYMYIPIGTFFLLIPAVCFFPLNPRESLLQHPDTSFPGFLVQTILLFIAEWGVENLPDGEAYLEFTILSRTSACGPACSLTSCSLCKMILVINFLIYCSSSQWQVADLSLYEDKVLVTCLSFTFVLVYSWFPSRV